MRKILIRILFLIGLVFHLALVLSCSPQARLNRIIKHHPELANTDTIYITKTIPGFNVDTIFKASTNTAGLDSVIIQYKTRIDTIILKQLQTQLKTVFINKPCLDQPINFTLPDGTKATLSQSGGKFNLKAVKPTTTQKIPVQTNTYKVQYKYSGRMFAFGFLLGFFFALFITVQYFKRGGKA